MSNKKTISIPANVGSNLLSEVFGKISLSTEVRELLSACDAELFVRFIPGAEKPVIGIQDKAGGTVCSLEEFKALSGYRRFVTTAIKEVEKETSTQEKIAIISYFLRKATAENFTIPDRILEQNQTKFNQFGVTLQTLAKHADVLAGTVDNEWKTYVVEKLARVARILYSAQTLCMGSAVVGKSYVEDELFNMGIPKWIYNKFLDRNFTTNLKNDCQTLLFPKNNYLKSISLSTWELDSEPFMTANKVVLAKSGGIIALAKTDWSRLYPDYNDVLEEQVENFIGNYQWVLTNPMTADEVLALRETGKVPPMYREVLPSKNKPGAKQRLESEFGKISRQIANCLGRIQSTWNGIMNFVIPVADPKTEFWVELFPNANTWEITPTNTMYNCIRNEGNLAPLTNLKNATSLALLRRIGNIVATVNRSPHGSHNSNYMITIFESIHNWPDFREITAFVDHIDNDHPLQNMDVLVASPVTTTENSAGKAFLGVREKPASKSKRSGGSAVRLNSAVLNELSLLKTHPIYPSVIDWLMTTFKSGKRRVLQKVAAERILGEAIKHQDTIFENDLEIEDLEEIEDYYDDSE
jgi:hypothetical protein